MGELLMLPRTEAVTQVDGRDMDGGGHIHVYLNKGTKDLFAELMYQGMFRQWLLVPENGRIDVKDVIQHPNYHMYRAMKNVGYLAVGEYDGG